MYSPNSFLDKRRLSKGIPVLYFAFESYKFADQKVHLESKLFYSTGEDIRGKGVNYLKAAETGPTVMQNWSAKNASESIVPKCIGNTTADASAQTKCSIHLYLYDVVEELAAVEKTQASYSAAVET